MINYWKILDFTSFLLFILIVWQILKGLLFWLWLWQVKEYRLDRLRLHFSLSVGRKQLLRSLNIFYFGGWLIPKFTPRIFLSFLLVCFANYNLYFFLLKQTSFIVKHYPKLLFPAFAFVLVIIFLLLPLIIGLLNLAFSLILWPVKELILFLARTKIDKLQPLVIGITGSFGKTSTKFILTQVLSAKFDVLTTPKSVNTPLGVAKIILVKLKKSHEIFVVEMGAYKIGEIKKLCWLTSPKIGILTGINNQHQALFGSFQKTKKAKYELVMSLPKDGLAVFNYANPTARALGKITKRVAVKFYGKARRRYKTKLLGKFQQINIDAARVMASFLRIPLKDTLKQITSLEPEAGMLQMKKGLKGSKILDDSFSANYNGFLKALDILKEFKGKKRILVTPGIIELGKQSSKLHEELAKKAAAAADLIILTDENFYEVFKKGLGEDNSNKLYLIKEKSDFKKIVKEHLNRRTVVLFEGRVPRYMKDIILL